MTAKNNRRLDDTLFVTVSYWTILNREPEELGLKNWKNELAKGTTRYENLFGFLASDEHVILCNEHDIAR